jgi:ATP-dependent Clp endopeptidase proteolytic subunit ClpP
MNQEKTTYIKFFAPVVPETINALMNVVDHKVIKEEIKHIVLLISTPGGNVFHGLSAYNYLKGLPIKVTTHNFGSADSIGSVLFCAGEERLSVPHARFLLHGVQMSINQNIAFEEDQLDEKLKSLRIDVRNISKVIADTTGKNIDKVVEDMRKRTTLNPEEAKEYGLVQEIRSELYPEGADVVSIQFESQPSPQK